MRPLIGFCCVLIVGVVFTGISFTGTTEPEEAKTDEYAAIAMRDRVIIFFIKIDYTITLNTFYRERSFVKEFCPRDRGFLFPILCSIMKPLQFLRHIIGLRSPLRIVYHWARGVLAYILSGNPSRGMYIIGVTGTKGKTTTSTLIATALEASGRQVCLLSTAQVWMAGEKTENHSKMTMDSPFKLWKMIRKAKKMGVTHLVLETSSHGIYYFRNFGIKYNIVVLTNISQDHLDLHGTMDHYVKTKARLFKREHGKICLLPRDCAYFDIFSEGAGEDALTYSMKQPATYQTRSLKTDGDGIDIVIKSSIPPEE